MLMLIQPFGFTFDFELSSNQVSITGFSHADISTASGRVDSTDASVVGQSLYTYAGTQHESFAGTMAVEAAQCLFNSWRNDIGFIRFNATGCKFRRICDSRSIASICALEFQPQLKARDDPNSWIRSTFVYISKC